MAEHGGPRKAMEQALAEVIAFLDPGGSPVNGFRTSTELREHLQMAANSAADSGWRGLRYRLFGPRWRFYDDALLNSLEKADVVEVDKRASSNWDWVVTMPAHVRTPLLDAMDTGRAHRAARVAASALEHAWLESEMYAKDALGGTMPEETDRLLFANLATLQTTAGDLLFQPETCHLLHWVGYHLRDCERHTPADLVAYLTGMVGECERLLGEGHPSTLKSRGELAEAHAGSGDHETAHVLHERVLAARQRILGPDHVDTLDSLGLLGAAQRATGYVDDAAMNLERAMEGIQTAQGPTGFYLDRHRDTLVATYRDLGRADMAVALRRDHLTAVEARLGATHPMTLGTRNELGATLALVGRLDEAEREYGTVLAAGPTDSGRVTETDREIIVEAEQGLAALR